MRLGRDRTKASCCSESPRIWWWHVGGQGNRFHLNVEVGGYRQQLAPIAARPRQDAVTLPARPAIRRVHRIPGLPHTLTPRVAIVRARYGR